MDKVLTFETEERIEVDGSESSSVTIILKGDDHKTINLKNAKKVNIRHYPRSLRRLYLFNSDTGISFPKTLTYLEVRGCSLQFKYSSISTLTNLLFLHLPENNLQSMLSVKNLTNLISLNLTGNDIDYDKSKTNFIEVAKLTKLVALSISGKGTIPAEIVSMENFDNFTFEGDFTLHKISNTNTMSHHLSLKNCDTLFERKNVWVNM